MFIYIYIENYAKRCTANCFVTYVALNETRHFQRLEGLLGLLEPAGGE